MSFMNFKGIGNIMVNQLNEDQKRAAILSLVASNMKIRWKDYNIPGRPTGNSAKLSLGGRGGTRPVESQIDKIYELELDKDVVANEIISLSIQTMHNMFIDIKETGRAKRRNSYMDAIEDINFLKMLFEITVILMGKKLVEDNQEIYHKYLEARILAVEKNKNDLSSIWREYTIGNIEKEIAIDETEKIFNNFEREYYSCNGSEMIQIGMEKALLEMVDETDLQNYLFGIIDEVRFQITQQPRLIGF